MTGPTPPTASSDKNLLVGYTDFPGFPSVRTPNIWTPEFGWAGFTNSLDVLGTNYIVKTPKVVICHAPPASVSKMHTVDLEFPGDLASHLAHGDTVGICGFGGP
jgi:hypothetical protein